MLPLFYLYLVQTCPSPATFDAERELKRVLRGHYLPEDNPEKPRGWLQETMASVTASVATWIVGIHRDHVPAGRGRPLGRGGRPLGSDARSLLAHDDESEW